MSVWLSVDPLASKYPNTSNYAYVENNPVKYVDPNGMYKKESKAIKAQAKAIDRYGKNNVSGVERHPSTGRYSFRIAKDGFRQTGSPDSDGGIVIKKERGKEIKGNFRLGLYNLFNPKGGQYGTADNGQGQETRSGDGQKTDLGEFTSDMPGYNPTTGDIGSSNENGKSEGLGKAEIQGRMHFERGASGDNASDVYVPYFDKEDSAIRRNKYDRIGYKYVKTLPPKE